MSTTGRWDELFAAARWRIAEEVSGTITAPDHPEIAITFTRGEFEITPPGAFASPLSTNLGRRGVLLQKTSADGSLDIPGEMIAVGAAAVRKAREEFGGIW